MSVERIEMNGTVYAEIIWAGTRVHKTTFFSAEDSSFQFGLLAHGAGYREPAHLHRAMTREISDLQQMFVMQFGVVNVLLFSDDGELLRTIRLEQGDAIVLIHGVHSIEVVEDFQALTVKQGPFLGIEVDKVEVKER